MDPVHPYGYLCAPFIPRFVRNEWETSTLSSSIDPALKSCSACPIHRALSGSAKALYLNFEARQAQLRAANDHRPGKREQ